MDRREYQNLRKSLGLNGLELCQAIGISVSAHRRYESGRQAIPMPVAILLRQTHDRIPRGSDAAAYLRRYHR